MSLKARQELLTVIAPRYQEATRQEKQPILNEFVAATGYHRKYAISLLRGYQVNPTVGLPKRKERQRVYTGEIQAALIRVWEAANRICSKRLVPFLPEMAEALERSGHLSLAPMVKERLLDISPATVDRLLAEVRRTGRGDDRQGGTHTSFLKQQVPIRTFSEWQGALPGFMEADLVAHCGGDVSGSYLHTLVMTDVVTGWTECLALLFRDQQMVLQAVRQAEEHLPIPLLALDTDNGSEFLNSTLFDYCQGKPIIFTRSRPYKKNDQCYVEQKNGAIVRQFVGYERFEGVEPCRVLAELYRHLRLYVNFFQPSLKLLSKKREGSRVIKKYDQARTPCQRLLAAESVSVEIKAQLKAQFGSLDPVQLLTQIQALQDELWSHAYIQRAVILQLPALNDPTSTREAQPQSTPRIILERQLAKPTAEANGTGAHHNGTGKIHVPAIEPTNGQRQRKYRHSKRKRRVYQGQRWWRTRKDPFAAVWTQAQQQLEQTPDLSAKLLFQALQRHHPGQFSQGQLRTFQRRVRTWRMTYIAGQSELNEPEKVPAMAS